MVWGAPRAGVDDLLARLAQPATARSLFVLPMRALTEADAQRLARAVASHALLEELYLSGHSLGGAALTAFADCLAQNTALRRLCLGDEALGDAGVRELSAALARNPRSALVAWDLELKGVTCDGAAALGEALALSSSALETLSLSRNAIGDAGVESLAAALAGNPSSRLSALSAASAALSGRALDALADLLARPTCALESLVLSFNDLSGASVRFFAALASNRSLKTLELKGCALVDAHAAALGDALATNAALEALDLSDNQLTAGACSALARGLASSRVRSLKLGGNAIGDTGAVALASGLGSGGASAPAALVTLDVGKNELSSAGMAALLSLPSLRSLGLFGNALGGGLGDVLPALTANQSLETLDLGANALHGARSAELFAAVRVHPSLSTLEMGGNALGAEGLAALEELRAANPRIDVAVDKSAQDEHGCA